MASSRKTLDIELITLRKVFIRGDRNSFVPSSSVLVSDGLGGTYWSLISTVGTYPSFQQINIDENSYTATPEAPAFSFLSGNGIGFADVCPGSNSTYLYAKAFQTVAVDGLSSISAFTNNKVTPVLTLSTLGGLQLSTDTLHQVIYFDAGIKYFNVLSNTPSFTETPTSLPVSFPILPAFSTLTFMGVGDINLSTTSNHSVYIGINGFTSEGYLNLSTQVNTLESSIITKASTLFLNYGDFMSTMSTLSSFVGHEISSYQISSTYLALSTLIMESVCTFSTTYSYISTNFLSNVSTYSNYFNGVNQSTISTFSTIAYDTLVSTSQGYSSFCSTVIADQLTSSFSTIYSDFAIGTSSFSTMNMLMKILNSTNFSTIRLTSSIVSTTLGFTRTSISTVSTTMTSSFLSYFKPRLNFVSSLTWTNSNDGVRGDNTLIFKTGNRIVLSTASLYFSSMLPLITSQSANVTLEYNPVILFPMAVNQNVEPQEISTFMKFTTDNITYTYLSSVNTDYMNWKQYILGGETTTSNLYSKYLRLNLDPKILLSNTEAKYIIYHTLPTAVPQCSVPPTTAHIRTSPQNSMFITITNTL